MCPNIYYKYGTLTIFLYLDGTEIHIHMGREHVSSVIAESEGTDQGAYPHSLIKAFAVR